MEVLVGGMSLRGCDWLGGAPQFPERYESEKITSSIRNSGQGMKKNKLQRSCAFSFKVDIDSCYQASRLLFAAEDRSAIPSLEVYNLTQHALRLKFAPKFQQGSVFFLSYHLDLSIFGDTATIIYKASTASELILKPLIQNTKKDLLTPQNEPPQHPHNPPPLHGIQIPRRLQRSPPNALAHLQ
jgi:hypothetical protein